MLHIVKDSMGFKIASVFMNLKLKGEINDINTMDNKSKVKVQKS